MSDPNLGGAARTLTRPGKLGTILIGALMVPVCAYLFGFCAALIAYGLSGRDRGLVIIGTQPPLLQEASDFAYICLHASVIGFPSLLFPLMCLTMICLQHMLRGGGSAGACAS